MIQTIRAVLRFSSGVLAALIVSIAPIALCVSLNGLGPYGAKVLQGHGNVRHIASQADSVFPIGIYHVPMSELPLAASAGFNVVTGWVKNERQAQEFLHVASNNHLKVLLELSTFMRGDFKIQKMLRIVAALKDNSALLAWYLVDEPHTFRQLSAGRSAYRKIRQIDPHHPVFIVLNQPKTYADFSSMADIVGIDPYPVPFHPVGEVTRWLRAAQNAVNGVKPVWLVAQAYDQTAYPNRREIRGPTPLEERNMVFQGIVHGVKGVLFYTWNDGGVGLVDHPALFAEVKKLVGQLNILSPELQGTRLPIETSSQNVEAALFASSRTSALLVVNMADYPERVRLSLPSGLGFQRNYRFSHILSGDRYLMRLNPLQAVVMRVTSKIKRR